MEFRRIYILTKSRSMLFVEIMKTEFVLLYREAILHLKLASRTQVVFLLRYRKFYELLVTWSENRRNLSPVHVFVN